MGVIITVEFCFDYSQVQLVVNYYIVCKNMGYF